jgi:hypothetical protein
MKFKGLQLFMSVEPFKYYYTTKYYLPTASCLVTLDQQQKVFIEKDQASLLRNQCKVIFTGKSKIVA